MSKTLLSVSRIGMANNYRFSGMSDFLCIQKFYNQLAVSDFSIIYSRVSGDDAQYLVPGKLPVPSKDNHSE